MNKEETIRRYGEEAWEKKLAQGRARSKRYSEAHREEHTASVLRWNKAHPEEVKANGKKWQEEHRGNRCRSTKKYRESHPDEVEALRRERARKGGRNYQQMLDYCRTGLPGERKRIRSKHNREFREIKATLAEEVELHHEWIGDTAEYRGVALVDKTAHRTGFIDEILLLDGEITLLTEEQIRNGGV